MERRRLKAPDIASETGSAADLLETRWPSEAFVRSFVRSLRAGVQPTLNPSAKTFISVQCASPGRGGELVGVCGVCARCVGWKKEQ